MASNVCQALPVPLKVLAVPPAAAAARRGEERTGVAATVLGPAAPAAARARCLMALAVRSAGDMEFKIASAALSSRGEPEPRAERRRGEGPEPPSCPAGVRYSDAPAVDGVAAACAGTPRSRERPPTLVCQGLHNSGGSQSAHLRGVGVAVVAGTWDEAAGQQVVSGTMRQAVKSCK
jgi:hypothetical protein